MPVDKNFPAKQLSLDFCEDAINFESFDPETNKSLEAKHLGVAWVLMTKLILRGAKDPNKAREHLVKAIADLDPETGFEDKADAKTET